MLFFERVLHASNALPDGCFGHICQQPANAYRTALLIFPLKFRRNLPFLFRSTNRHYLICTLSNNLRILLSKLRDICVQRCFALSFTLQNQEDCGHPGRQIHFYVRQFFFELALKQPSKSNVPDRPSACKNVLRRAVCHLQNNLILRKKYIYIKEYSV